MFIFLFLLLVNVKLTDLGSQRIQVVIHAQALSTHSIKYDQSQSSNILSRQEGWSFKMMGLWLTHNRYKNPIYWDFWNFCGFVSRVVS